MSRFTKAPLRFEGMFEFDAPIQRVFSLMTDPKMISRWMGPVRDGYFDHDGSRTPGQCDTGSVRYCHTANMGTLAEKILLWEAPYRCVYSLSNPRMPITDFAAVMEFNEIGSNRTAVRWRQHFNYTGYVMRYLFPYMMVAMLNRGMKALRQQVGGQGGRMKRVAAS